MRKFKVLSLVLSFVLIISSLTSGVVIAEQMYTVQSGDVLWKIADMYDTDWETLSEYNSLADPNLIYPEQVINIPDDSVTITALGTTDIHGRIFAYQYAVDAADKDAGLLKIQTLVKEERANSDNVILMDMGDLTQDNSAELFKNDDVTSMIAAVNYMNYDTWTIGNHQFNYEKDITDKNIATFEGTTLAANIYNDDGTRFVEAYQLFEFEGVRVAVVGLTPSRVPVWEAANPSRFEGLYFTDTVTEAQKVVAELEGQYDVLIGAFHLPEGDEEYGDDYGYKGAASVAEGNPEFDVIFMGHAHSKVNDVEVNGVKLIEPGKYGWALGKAEITVKSVDGAWVVDTVVTSNIETYSVVEDAEMAAEFAYVHERSLADAYTVVGLVTEDYIERVDYITGEASVTTMPTSQIQDTALIDLINEVQMFYSGAEISSAATFTSDMNLEAGEFMKKDAAYIYKYDNTLIGVNITGANLKAYMEWSAQYFNTYNPGDLTVSFNENVRGYNYDMFAGVVYDIDISKAAGERITNLTFNGAEIVDDQVYKLAVNNYRVGTLMGLGFVTTDDKFYDSYTEMQDAGRIRELISKYIEEVKAGVATPELDNNWKLIGYDFDHPLFDEVQQMIIDGEINIPTSEDGRTYNVEGVNIGDLIEDGYFADEYELTVVHTNDVHGFYIEGKYDGIGAAKLGTFIDETRAANTNTLVLDAGDALQGHNLVTLSEGEYGVDVMNALGYDAMAAGNHEFDYGSDQLLSLEAMLDFPMLAANVTVDADGSNFVESYVIKEMDGLTVGIFGLATPETTYKSHPDNTIGLTFEDPIVTAEAMVAELDSQVDVIIALAHLGIEGDSSSILLAESVAGIDLIIDGHSHTDLDYGMEVNGTLIVSAGEKSKNIGVVKFDVEGGVVVEVDAYQFDKSDAVDAVEKESVLTLVTELKALNDIIANEVVATSPVILNGEREFVRTGETNMGNMLTESLLDISGADVALSNGGGIRTSIDAGEVTKGEVLTVLPFGNTVRVIELTGADIIAAIENGIDEYPEAKGAFPHVAGMTVKFDSSKEAGSRVVEILVGGVLIDEAATYTMATNDFLVAGGDGYSMFTGKNVVAEYGAMDEVLIDFMNASGFDAAAITDRMMDVAE